MKAANGAREAKPARAGSKSTLNAALVANAAKSAEQRLARLRSQAQDDIDLVKVKQTQIVDAFYEIGQALVRLKADGVAQAMGREGFADLLEKELGMSLTTAERLMSIVLHVRRADALRWGQDKSSALVELAKATADPTDSPKTIVSKKKLKLASGRVLDLEAAKPSEILDAAKAERLRRQRDGKARRGRTTTAEERALAGEIEKALHAAGVAEAKVEALATKPGQAANLRIERVPIDRIAALRTALGAAKRGR